VDFSVRDYASTTAWIGIRIAVREPIDSLLLMRGDSIIWSAPYNFTDTLIQDVDLNPATAYRYHLIKRRNGADFERITCYIETKPLTSHTYSFHFDTLGVSATTLEDVVVINDSCAWIVGAIFADGPTLYNLAFWDGKSWSLRRLSFEVNGSANLIPLYSIFELSERDLWIGTYAALHMVEGSVTVHNTQPILVAPITSVWASSDNDVYVGCDRGTIGHWNGSTWQRIESGTTNRISSLDGRGEGTGDYSIIGVANDWGVSDSGSILSITSSSVKRLPMTGLPIAMEALHSFSRYYNYIVGNGIASKADLSSSSRWKFENVRTSRGHYWRNIGGRGSNDIFVCGDYSGLVHFNGKEWNDLSPLVDIGGDYRAVSQAGNTVIAIGYLGGQGIVAVGKLVK
jgi:hypothetical protein